MDPTNKLVDVIEALKQLEHDLDNKLSKRDIMTYIRNLIIEIEYTLYPK